MKIHIANNSKTTLGGGFRFLENFRKGMIGKDVQFVNSWQEADIVFMFSISAIDKNEIWEAKRAGKKLVLRVDNIPRKSRNRGQSPVERLAEFGKEADLVVYQSNWCKKYAGYFIKNDNEVIINNGVDTSIFNTEGRFSDGDTYLYLNYNDNPNKRFDEALYWFDMRWRENNNAHLIIAGNTPSIYLEHPEYNWDLPVPAKVEYVGILNNPHEVAKLMKRCDVLLYPSFAEAYPNTVLEALACGLKIENKNTEGGTQEATVNFAVSGTKTIQEMCDEYYNQLKKICE